MKCSKCGAQLASGVMFCRECGAKVEQRRFCRDCGASLEAGAQFCSNCGAKIDFESQASSCSQKTDAEKIEYNTPKQNHPDSGTQEAEASQDFQTEDRPRISARKFHTDNNPLSGLQSEDTDQPEQKSENERPADIEKPSFNPGSIWKNLPLFYKITSISILVIILLFLVAVYLHKWLPIVIAFFQLCGFGTAILMQEKVLCKENGWLKYVILTVAIMLTALYVFCFIAITEKPSYSKSLSKSNSSVPSTSVVSPSTHPNAKPTAKPTPSPTSTPAATPTATPSPTHNTVKPERNGFDEKTNTTIVFRQFSFSVPDYWNSGEKSENNYSSLCFENESEGKCARLNIGINRAYPFFDLLKYSIELGEFEEKLTKDFENIAGLQYFSFKKENITGFLFSWNCTVEGFPCNVKYLIWPSLDGQSSYFIYCEEINTDYSYSSDFYKILDSITRIASDATLSPTPKADDAVSYSTNSKSTAKNGNSGVYSYAISGSYDVVYIIDFDEGYVYRFLDTDSVGEKVKIVSGDLNSVLIITYYDDGVTWSNGLHFKWKNQPDHVILEDDDGFEYDLYPTNLNTALYQLEMRKIYDYSPP